MKLVSFRERGSASAVPRLGVLGEHGVVREITADSGLPSTMAAAIGNPERLRRVEDKLNSLSQRSAQDIVLCAPVPQPQKNVICVGKNYRAHALEFQSSGFDASSGGQVVPEYPAVFSKPYTTIIASGEPIPASSDETNSVDYEGELVVVIGRGGRGIPRERALDHVFGYTLANDVTARVVQSRHKQWFLGKSLDGFCPMGPSIVTADEVPDPTRLRLRTEVNGDLRQNASVADLIFDIPYLIASISRIMTLSPGDMIATGTPEGVGIGFKPPRYLKPGDRVDITVAEIGTLSNPVT